MLYRMLRTITGAPQVAGSPQTFNYFEGEVYGPDTDPPLLGALLEQLIEVGDAVEALGDEEAAALETQDDEGANEEQQTAPDQAALQAIVLERSISKVLEAVEAAEGGLTASQALAIEQARTDKEPRAGLVAKLEALAA